MEVHRGCSTQPSEAQVRLPDIDHVVFMLVDMDSPFGLVQSQLAA